MTMEKNRYGKRVLAANVEVSNDTRISGCNNNDIICGTSGSGKTGGYVIPNIQNIDSSLVVSDTKGQLERRFRSELEAKGYQIYTLDLVNPMRSCGYNPMAFIRRYSDGSYREQDILSLARLICPSMDRDDPIWDMSAASYIAFLISYCLETEKREDRKNLVRVGELHRQFSQPNGDVQFLEWVLAHRDSFAAKKYYEITANRIADRMFSSIIGFVNVNLEPYSFREAKNIFAKRSSFANRNISNNFDIKELGNRKTVLFLNVSDTDRAFDQLVNIFYSQTLQLLCSEADANEDGRLKVPVRIIMDDFASSAVIPNFDKIISVIRSRDIYVSLIIQSLSQLESMYSPAVSRTILNNCDHMLYLGSKDLETANYIAAMAKKTPEAILGMSRSKAYLITYGEQAKLVDKIVPYSTVNKPEDTRKEEEEKPQGMQDEGGFMSFDMDDELPFQ